MRKKRWKIIFSLLAGTVSLAFLIWVSGIAAAFFGKIQPEFPAEVESTPAHQVELGSEVKLRFTALIPADRQLEKTGIHCGSSSVAPLPVKSRRGQWLWNKSRYSFEAVIRPIKIGIIPAGKITIQLSPARGESSAPEISVRIPEFKVILPPGEKNNSDLQLSPLMDEPPPASPVWQHFKKYRYPYAVVILLLLAAAILLWLWIRHKCRPVPLTAWEKALNALQSLRFRIASGEVTVDNGFNELTDILREYMEKRYGFPASRCTTDEFLNRLAQGGFPLPEAHKTPLADFLGVADLIRFARMPSDSGMLDRAAMKMVQLVQDTAGNAEKE